MTQDNNKVTIGQHILIIAISTVGVFRNGIKNPKFLKVLENVVILLFIAIMILVVAAAIEVYFTPIFFS